jgi:hypothetical protein
MTDKVTIASLNKDDFHIFGMNLGMEEVKNVKEYINYCAPELKFIIIPCDKIDHVKIATLTDEQVQEIKKQLK